MNRFSRSLVLTLVWIVAANDDFGQSEDPTATVPVKISATGYMATGNTPADPTANGLDFHGSIIWPNPVGADIYTTSGTYPFQPQVVTETLSHLDGDFRVVPGKTYQLLMGHGDLQNASLNIVAPPGYRTVIDGMSRTRVNFAGDWLFYYQVEPTGGASTRSNAMIAEFLTSASITMALNWEMSLGSQHNGSSVGKLVVADNGVRSDWSPLFTPATISYETGSDEVAVYRQNDILRQLIANQVAVDIVVLNSTSYEIRCYNPAQVTTGSPPWAFSGSAFVTYRISQGSTGTSLIFTKEVRNITDFVSVFPVARRESMTISRTSTGPNWDDFTWTRTAWVVDGQTAVAQTTTQSVHTGTGTRTESITVRPTGLGADTFKMVRAYGAITNIGETVASETVGTVNGRTGTFDYYNGVNTPDGGLVKSVGFSGGGWVAMDYQQNPAQPAQIKYRYGPFENWPSSITLNTSMGEVTHYEYTTDEVGAETWPSLIETFRNGVQTTKATFSYAFDQGYPAL